MDNSMSKKEYQEESIHFLIDAITVPRQHGSVKERFKGTDDRLLVLLQNIPYHPECQKNNVENMRILLDQYQFHLILIEGSHGSDLIIIPPLSEAQKDNAELFLSIKDRVIIRSQPEEWIKKFARKQLEGGYYSAADYLYLTCEIPPRLSGVGDAEIVKTQYDLVHYKFLIENRSRAEDIFKRLKEGVALAEEKLYSPTLKTAARPRSQVAELDRLAKALSYCEKLGRISLIPAEWEEYSQQLAPFSIPQLRDFLAEIGVTVSAMEEEIAFLDQYRKEGETCYRIAIAHQRATIKNSLAELSNQGVNKAILVAPGFHTLGISRFLRDNSISYVVIAPRITQPDMPTPHHELLMKSIEKHGI